MYDHHTFKMKYLVVLAVLVSVVNCDVIQESVLKSVIGNFVNCANSDLLLCVQEKALLASERFGSFRQLKITDSVTLVNNAPEKETSPEPLSADLEVRRQQVSERLSARAAKLLETTDLEVSFGGEADDDDIEGRDIGEARGDSKKKKKKGAKKKIKMLLPLLQLLKAKVALLVIGAVLLAAVSAFKLLVLAKIAFIVKAFFIIKELLSKHKEEWVHHEEVVHHDHHGWEDAGHGHGWGRVGKDGSNDLAYSAYNKNSI